MGGGGLLKFFKTTNWLGITEFWKLKKGLCDNLESISIDITMKKLPVIIMNPVLKILV